MSKQILNIILYAANFIVLFISGMTNKIGADLIWGGDDATTKGIFSWGIAISLTLLLFYISALIPHFTKEGKGYRLIFGYTIISLLSVFFNFQAIHSRLTTGKTLESTSKSIRDQLSKLSFDGEQSLRATYSIDNLKEKTDSLLGEKEAEKRHVERPGEGWRFADWDRQFKIDSLKLATKINEFEIKNKSIKERIDNAISGLDTALIKSTEGGQRIAIDKAKESYNSIVSEIKSIDTTFKQDYISNKSETLDKPDQVLQVLLNFFVDKDKFSKDQQASIYLSLFLSFLLDFPIFFILVILNWPSKSKIKSVGNNKKSNNQNIWQ